MENTNKLPELKADADTFLENMNKRINSTENKMYNSPCFYLVTELDNQSQKPLSGIFLKEYSAISAVGVMLGDIGGAIANTKIPENYTKATVSFCAFSKFTESHTNLESISQVMCIPKNIQPDQRCYDLLNAITFNTIDMTRNDIPFAQEHLDRLDEDANETNATLYAGVGFWALQITPLTTK